jgi:hypothetical protein
MINAPSGRPIRNNAPRALERFHIYLLLVLGIAFIGAGATALGFAIASPAAVGVGVGAVVAAGLVAIIFALAGSRRTFGEESVRTDVISMAPPPTRDPDPEKQRRA